MGTFVGDVVGCPVKLGRLDGAGVGTCVGIEVIVGKFVGGTETKGLGICVGPAAGNNEGRAVGEQLGTGVGEATTEKESEKLVFEFEYELSEKLDGSDHDADCTTEKLGGMEKLDAEFENTPDFLSE